VSLWRKQHQKQESDSFLELRKSLVCSLGPKVLSETRVISTAFPQKYSVPKEITLDVISSAHHQPEKQHKKLCHSRSDSGFVCIDMSIEDKFRAAVKVIQSLPNDGNSMRILCEL
jgi:hypothetical protein